MMHPVEDPYTEPQVYQSITAARLQVIVAVINPFWAIYEPSLQTRTGSQS